MTAAPWEGWGRGNTSVTERPRTGSMGAEEDKSNHDLSLNILLKDVQETIQIKDSKYTALIPGIKSVRSMNT